MNAPWDDDDDGTMSLSKRLAIWIGSLVPLFNLILFVIEYAGPWKPDPAWLIALIATTAALIVAPIAAVIAHFRAMTRDG